MLVVENYPDLKANQNFLQLQGELTNTEDRLQTARRFYNANVRDYNRRVKQFPSVVVASLFNFEEEEFFEVEDAIREGGAPQVDFGAPAGSGAPLANEARRRAERPSVARPRRPRRRPATTCPSLRASRRRRPRRLSPRRPAAREKPSTAVRRLIERVSTLHTTAQTTAIAPRRRAATRGPAASAIAEATRLEIASDSVIIAKSKAKTRPRMWSGTSTCRPNVESTHCAPPPRCATKITIAATQSVGRESERHVRDAEHRQRDADRAEEPPVAGAADAVPEERADQRAHAARGHQRADPDLASVEDVDAEDRDQREHARRPGRTPP